MAQKTEHCENCGRTIGKLEIAHIYRDHLVCADCDGRLRIQDESKKPTIQSNNVSTHFADSAQSETKQRWNGFCITAFVLSLLLIPIFPIPDVPQETMQLMYVLCIIQFLLSVIFACVGLSQVGRNPSMRGKGLGIAAIIISIASAFIIILF